MPDVARQAEPIANPRERAPGDALNIAFEAVVRHADGELADTVALRFLPAAGPVVDCTYRQLRAATDRFAAALEAADLPRGARVATLLGRVPPLYVAALGTLRYGAVYCPLFAAFGPEPVRDRLALGEVAVLITTATAYERKVAPFRNDLPALKTVLVVDGDPPPAGTISWDDTLDHAPDRPAGAAPTAPGDPALLHFTSGTTGRPKGALHVHEAVVAHHASAALALDLHPGDVYWCTADPGWVTGTSYGIIGPLTCGVTTVVDAGDFEARRWYQILAEQRVSVWYTAPTAIRMLMRAGDDLPKRFDLSALRHVASVGEPLNAEAVRWGERALGLPIHDTWWQTETGAIMIANLPGMPIRAGSMGRAMPGIQAAVLARDEDAVRLVDGHVRELDDPDAVGELALRPGWPSMFREYVGDPQRYAACFTDGWYLSGDLARRDADGYFWFVGRGDDVIKSAGHLVGPFEVESVLMEHPAVVEAGVIGTPDPLAGEVVKAVVTLRAGCEPDERLRRELIAFGRRRLGALAPRQIAFDQNLPHTRSGKIMRRLLKARELGLPEGDTSTLETTAEVSA